MALNLNNIVQFIAILSFTAGVLKYLIVNPLQKAIEDLKEAIFKMDSTLFRLEQEQKYIDKRLIIVEESTKSAHRRIDGIEALDKKI